MGGALRALGAHLCEVTEGSRESRRPAAGASSARAHTYLLGTLLLCPLQRCYGDKPQEFLQKAS